MPPGRTLAGGRVGTSRGLTEEPADGSHSPEEGLGEAGSEAQGTAIGQSQDDRPVLGPEEEAGVRQDPVFVQGPVGLQQPLSFLFPPNGMV